MHFCVNPHCGFNRSIYSIKLDLGGYDDMNRSTNIGLWSAIIISILSASALSGEKSNSFSFLTASETPSFLGGIEKSKSSSTPDIITVAHRTDLSRADKAALSRSLATIHQRRQTFVSRIIDDLKSKQRRQYPQYASRGEI